MSSDAVQRFHEKYIFDGMDGCAVWTAARSTSGYGQFRVGPTSQARAHRFSYEQFVGPIPDGLVIDHLCRNPLCVNPEHLRAVTQKENLHADGSQAPARLFAAKTHCTHGHEYTPENTLRHRGYRQCRACRTAYNKRIWRERHA